ncbi:MAG: outer membrane beta-barrel protein [Methylovirgula sp.]
MAAIFAAAADTCASAQQMTPAPAPEDTTSSQAPALQAPPLPPPELRGTEAPPLNDLSADGTPQDSDDTNPIAAEPPQYGLPPPVSSTADVINYGRRKPKKSQLYQLPRIKRPGQQLLPPLTPYETAPDVKKRGSNPPTANLTDPGPTVAVIPTLPRPLRPKPDLTPFDAIGVDVGALRLYPYVETDTGYDTNPNLLPTDVVPSAYVHAETGMKAQSDWSQSSLTADLRGGYYDYFSVPTANRPDAAGTITGRVDVTRQTQINSQTTFSLTTEQPGSPILAIPNAVFITNRPLYATVGQMLGVTQQFNRLSVSLSGAFTRYAFGDATQSDGTILELSLDDNNVYAVAGRLSYEVTPTLIPYLQVTGAHTQYDSPSDAYGYDRTSNSIQAKAGTSYEATPLITGDLALGYENGVYADYRLPVVSTPTVDATLIYTPTPLTTVTFTAATDVGQTTLANASAAIGHIFTLKLSHELLRDVTISATGTYQFNTYVGQPVIENYYAGLFEVDYHMTRSILITGSYKYQRFVSSVGLTNYTDQVFLAGLKFQL